MDLGLLAGLANGVKEGMLAYQTASQIKRQQQMENLQKGLVENPQTGQLEYTPEAREKMQYQKELQGLQLQKLRKELTGEGSIEDQYKKAQIDYMKSKMGTEEARTGLLGAKKESMLAPKMEKPVTPGQEYKNLPKENQVQLNLLATQKAKTQSVDNLMGSLLTQLEDPKISDNQKVVSSLEQLKLMNSQLGPDALGAGEAERVSAWLDNAPHPFVGKYSFGPDINQFKTQLSNAVNRNKKSMGLLDTQIKQLYGKGAEQAAPIPQAPQAPQAPKFEADVLAYAKMHNITPEQAAQIKAQRNK